ncbi:MAG: hypothetical protein IJX26_03155 [Clostridia bacterium]|nr:hypothetical protein [Clostridia bacterium]
MIITFCGNSKICETEKKILKDKILNYLDSQKFEENIDFYLGGYGNFDGVAYYCCKQYKLKHPNAKLHFITPYLDEKYLRVRDIIVDYDNIIYPNLESTPKKYCILKRNEWIIKNSDLVIAYIKYTFGGAAKMLEQAKKSPKKYINFAEI